MRQSGVTMWRKLAIRNNLPAPDSSSLNFSKMLCSVWSEESQKVNRILLFVFFYWQQLNNRILASLNIIEGLTHIEQP